MAATYTFSQGEDLVVEIPVFDKVTNAAVDLTAATDIVVVLYQSKVAKTKYSLTAQVGYGTVAIKAGVGNEHIIEVLVKRADSKLLSVGYAQANVLVELPDATLTDKRTEYTYPSYILVQEGLTKDEIVD